MSSAVASDPVLSIITLNRNGAALLQRLFASFTRVNLFRDYEFLLVDHNSTDRSLEVARAWSERIPLQIHRVDSNPSYSYSCNRAAERARGRILLFLNNDVAFVDDFVGRAVALLDGGAAGLIGIRQHNEGLRGGPFPVGVCNHVGVWLRPNVALSLLSPYNVRPRPLMRGGQPLEEVMAVTAAAMLCRRSDYLAVGGFHEGYHYGYEDVDFCLRFQQQIKSPVVCMNDVRLIHTVGATRRKVQTGELAALQLRDNSRLLDERCGYLFRRLWLESRLDSRYRGWTAQPRMALFVLPNEPQLARVMRRLARAWERQTGWVSRVTDLRSMIDGAYDLIVVGDPRFRLANLFRMRPVATLVALADLPGWGKVPVRDLQRYDFIATLLPGAGADAALTAAFPCRRLGVESPRDAQQALLQSLREGLAERFRIVLRVDQRSELLRGLTAALAAALRLRGHLVQTQAPGDEHSRPYDLKFDASVVFGTPEQVCAPSSQIRVLVPWPMLRGSNAVPGFDSVLPLDLQGETPERLADRLTDALRAAQQERLRLPIEPPLDARRRSQGLRVVGA